MVVISRNCEGKSVRIPHHYYHGSAFRVIVLIAGYKSRGEKQSFVCTPCDYNYKLSRHHLSISGAFSDLLAIFPSVCVWHQVRQQHNIMVSCMV